MKEPIDLLNEIRNIDRSSWVVFTTFKYNQYFFEKYLFPRFKKTLPLVLVDYHEYQNELRESGGSTKAGTRYLVDSVSLKEGGTFHPKLVLSCSKDEIRLFVSSANLTPAGFSLNAEICDIAVIPYQERDRSLLLQSACEFLSLIKERVASEPHRSAIESLLARIDLGGSPSSNGSDTFLLHNLRDSIIHQVQERLPEKVEKIQVVAPYFSQDPSFYTQLVDIFTHEIDLILQQNNNNLPSERLQKLRSLDSLKLYSISLEHNRPLHGKMVIFHTKNYSFALTGSANFTKHALGLSTRNGGNVELCVLRRKPRGYFHYLFDPSILGLDEVKWTDVKSNVTPFQSPVKADFRILQASVKGNTLTLVIDFETELPESFQVCIERLATAKEIVCSGGILSLQLSDQELQTLSLPSIVSINLIQNGLKLTSDLKLIHNPQYFPEQFSALSSLVDEDERTWLFRILSKLANLPSFNYVLPILDRMEQYGFFEKSQIDRAELLLKLQEKLSKVKPYSANEQIIDLIERFRRKHEIRMKKALSSRDIEQLSSVIQSFFLINELIIWLVRRGLVDVNYLRFSRENVERLLDYLDLKSSKVLQFIQEMKLCTHVLILSYVVDQLQRQSPVFRMWYEGRRNYVKEVFDQTFVSAVSQLRVASSSYDIANTLPVVASQYKELVPDLSFNIDDIIRVFNGMVAEANVASPGHEYLSLA